MAQSRLHTVMMVIKGWLFSLLAPEGPAGVVDGCVVDGCVVDGCVVDGCMVDGWVVVSI